MNPAFDKQSIEELPANMIEVLESLQEDLPLNQQLSFEDLVNAKNPASFYRHKNELRLIKDSRLSFFQQFIESVHNDDFKTNYLINELSVANGDFEGGLLNSHIFDFLQLENCSLENCEFSNCDFNHCNLYSVMRNVKFLDCDFYKVKFIGDMHANVFINCSFYDCEFVKSNLVTTYFPQCEMNEIKFIKCTLGNKMKFLDLDFTKHTTNAKFINSLYSFFINMLGIDNNLSCNDKFELVNQCNLINVCLPLYKNIYIKHLNVNFSQIIKDIFFQLNIREQ